jgi:hypothetical protein
MTLYVLDTDIISFAFQRHPTVLQRLQHLPKMIWWSRLLSPLAMISVAGCLPVAVLPMEWPGRGRMRVCTGA